MKDNPTAEIIALLVLALIYVVPIAAMIAKGT